MNTKLLQNISDKNIKEFLSMLGKKLTKPNTTSKQLSMHDSKTTIAKLLYNDFWLELVLEPYLSENYQPILKTQPIEFFQNNDSKNKPSFSVEHIKNGQINVFLSKTTNLEMFHYGDLDLLKKSLIATNHSIDTIIHEDSLYNLILAISSAGCNKHINEIQLEPSFKWLSELPNIYDIAHWLNNYIAENNLKKDYNLVSLALDYTAKSNATPVTESIKSKITPDNKLNRVHDQTITTNALISTSYRLNLSEMIMDV